MKAQLTNYRQSPRKVALVAGLIRGKKVSDALTSLRFAVKRASTPIEKLLNSAIANAKNAGVDAPQDLYIIEIRVDKGKVMRRYMPRARGSASAINKRSSHIMLSLGTKEDFKKNKVANHISNTSSSKLRAVTLVEADIVAAPKAKVKKAKKAEKTEKAEK